MLNVLGACSPKCASHTFVEAWRCEPAQVLWPELDLEKVLLLKEVDDVLFHPLAHGLWIDGCHRCSGEPIGCLSLKM